MSYDKIHDVKFIFLTHENTYAITTDAVCKHYYFSMFVTLTRSILQGYSKFNIIYESETYHRKENVLIFSKVYLSS